MHFEDIELLMRDEFLAEVESLVNAEAGEGAHANGLPSHIELQMRDGMRWHLRVKMEPLRPAEMTEMPAVLRGLNGFHARGPKGGAVLFNAENVAFTTVFPKPPRVPDKAWRLKARAD